MLQYYLSFHPSIYSFIYLSIYSFIHISIYISIYLLYLGQEAGPHNDWSAREDVRQGGPAGRVRGPGQVPLGDPGNAQCIRHQVGF